MSRAPGAPSPTRAAAPPRDRPSEAPPVVPALLRPLASYHLLLASTLLLVGLGLVMVFSASSVQSYATTGSSYAVAARQAVYLAIGLPLMHLAARVPVRVWRIAGYPLLLASLGLLVLVLVPGVGNGTDGAVRWISLPVGFNLQPSELAKLALALWGADLLVRKRRLLGDWKHLLVPLVPVAVVVLGLVMLEPDMGTTLVTTTVVLALLWVVGTPGRYFGVLLGTLTAAASVLAVVEPYRLQRLVSFLDPCSDTHRLDGGFQACQGLLAMGSGGVFGLGLGASREKWSGGLPNPHTDFVFAIIGEELGLLGSLSVLLLFATLVYAGVRVAKRTPDPFARLAASAVTAWLGVQAVINMGAVVGLLPITGIPLPLVSYGGSALLLNLLAIGMLLSFARREPGAAEALAARRGGLRRLVGRGAAGRRSAGGTGSRSGAAARGPGGSRHRPAGRDRVGRDHATGHDHPAGHDRAAGHDHATGHDQPTGRDHPAGHDRPRPRRHLPERSR